MNQNVTALPPAAAAGLIAASDPAIVTQGTLIHRSCAARTGCSGTRRGLAAARRRSRASAARCKAVPPPPRWDRATWTCSCVARTTRQGLRLGPVERLGAAGQRPDRGPGGDVEHFIDAARQPDTPLRARRRWGALPEAVEPPDRLDTLGERGLSAKRRPRRRLGRHAHRGRARSGQCPVLQGGRRLDRVAEVARAPAPDARSFEVLPCHKRRLANDVL